MSAPLRRRVLAAAIAGVGLVACGALLVWQVDVDAVGEALWTADGAPLLLAVGLMGAVIVAAAFKVRAVCAAGGLVISRRRSLKAVLTAATLNPLVPGRGGELVKAMVLAPEPRRRWDAVALVIAERMLDLTVVAAGAVVAGAVAGEPRAVLAGAVVWVAVAGALGAGRLLRGRGGKLARATDALAVMARDPVGLARATLWTACTWSGNVGILGATLWAAGSTASVGQVAFAAPVSMLAGMLPITVAGLGTREAALVLLLGSSLANPPLVAAGLLYTVCTVGVSWAVGAVALSVGFVARPPAVGAGETAEGDEGAEG